jgi:hypothetical protein
VPSLCSFWLAALEPAPASLLLSVMLPLAYAVDRARSNYLPQWWGAAPRRAASSPACLQRHAPGVCAPRPLATPAPGAPLAS